MMYLTDRKVTEKIGAEGATKKVITNVKLFIF
jgi:hypothetical protein